MPVSSKNTLGASLEVQWLRFCASTAGGAGLIPGWGSFSSQEMQPPKKKLKKKGEKSFIKRMLLVKQYKIINFINSCHWHTDHFTILCEELENINTILLYTQIQ